MQVDVILENCRNLVSLVLIVSKPELVIFLEQKKGPWDVKRKETAAIHPALSSHDTQGLLPKKPDIEDLFKKVLLGKYRSCGLGNLYLMKDWDCKGECEGHLVYAANNHSNHFEYRIGLNLHSNMFENQ
ncbi:KRAB domain-containing protein 5-like, partial [Balaenoptera acutorostrata]|uniref:KRAB domain-containing protein 5-like n=1 Tax=Balaenoptera acutorostrata TaxID=9767 RepID=A0ABM3TWD0_BALAC